MRHLAPSLTSQFEQLGHSIASTVPHLYSERVPHTSHSQKPRRLELDNALKFTGSHVSFPVKPRPHLHLPHIKFIELYQLRPSFRPSLIEKMEVETQTQTLPAFDNPPFSYSLTDLGSRDFRSSEMSGVDPKCLAPEVLHGAPASDTDALGGEWSELTAAVKVQKVYRSYRTRRRLADSAVVVEEYWWQAIDAWRLNRSTISFFDLGIESAIKRWNRVGKNASKVGKGLSKDAKAQKLAFQHWIEAIDPRHRYGHSLHVYYEEWSKAEAGQPFFYWLDVGDGKDIDLKECPRSKLRQQCIKYLGPQERMHYEYIVEEGRLIHSQTEELLDTKDGSLGAKWIFVMSTSKKLYAGLKRKGVFHHSSFLAGGATIAAGRLEAEKGILKSISAYSGHYRPTDDRLDTFLSVLKENGVNLDEVKIRKASDDSDSYDDGKSNGGTTFKMPTNFETPQLEILGEVEKTQSPEPTELPQPEAKPDYQRTLSGGLQSPRPEVPKNKILERINSKTSAKSYQLGHQLSLKWSTGAGPRIGCVADYPIELRTQALEFVNLSPKSPPTPSYRRFPCLASPTSGLASPTSGLVSPTSGFASPTLKSTSDVNNGV